MSADYRHLRADRLADTAELVAGRVLMRFPEAGLAEVASTLTHICRESAAKAELIRQPIWWLRITLAVLAVFTLASAVALALSLEGNPFARFLEFTRQTGGALVYLGAGLVFLVTLETRLKRYRAVQAIHELRALAHIIDMHQLSKMPDGETYVGKEPLTPDSMRQYLRFCTDMLAILSKIGQLYVQDFPDGTTLSAVDQFENLATGLSSKIWQKIMVLEEADQD